MHKRRQESIISEGPSRLSFRCSFTAASSDCNLKQHKKNWRLVHHLRMKNEKGRDMLNNNYVPGKELE